jgi:cyanate lyase
MSSIDGGDGYKAGADVDLDVEREDQPQGSATAVRLTPGMLWPGFEWHRLAIA